jgi:hypothetical protein
MVKAIIVPKTMLAIEPQIGEYERLILTLPFESVVTPKGV